MKSQIFVIIFLMSGLVKGSEFNSSLLSQSETSANESEKNDDCYIARGSLLPANTRFDMVFTSGLRGTLYGGTIGLLAASIDRDADNLGYIFYPAIGLSLGLLGGLTYGILSEIDSGFDSGRLNLGLSVCYEAAMSEQRKYGEHYSCTFRYPNHNHFFPDNYNFNVGYEEWETVPGEFESRVNQYKYGIEFTKTNYCVSFSSLYGLGIGLAVGDYKKI